MTVIETLDAFKDIGYEAVVDDNGMVFLQYQGEGEPPHPTCPVVNTLLDELYMNKKEYVCMFIKGLYP